MKIKKVDIFSNIVPLKGYSCNKSGDCNEVKPNWLCFLGGTIDYGVSLYIYVQGSCNAYCKFCNMHCEKNEYNMDFDVLENSLKELKNKVIITRIGITGGEPFLDFERLDHTIAMCKKYFPDIQLTVHTNGTFLNKIDQLNGLNQLDEIHISRHHYDDNVNSEIFQSRTSNEHDICNVGKILKNKIYLNCVLIKNYIDTEKKVEKYLEWALSCSIHNVVFVDLTNLNSYCKENFVDLFKLNLENNFHTCETVKNINICSCFKGKYISPYNHKAVNLFFRQTKSWPTKCYHYLEFKNNKLFAGKREITTESVCSVDFFLKRTH